MSATEQHVRMTPEARREQLLAVGAELFGDAGYEQVWVEEVARRAGVSRGLLYHYFPTKRDFFLAVLERNARALREVSAGDPALAGPEQLRASVRTYLERVSRRSDAYRAAYRGGLSADPQVRDVIRKSQEQQTLRILGAVMRDGAEPPQAVRLVVQGWVQYLITVALGWLEDPELPMEDVVELAAGTLESGLHLAFTLTKQEGS